jgi:hypothetical protein
VRDSCSRCAQCLHLLLRETFVTYAVELSATTVAVGRAVAEIEARKTFRAGTPARGVIAGRER